MNEQNFKSGEVEAEAFLAGNDMLTLPNDMNAAIKSLKAYLQDGRIPESRLEESVKKILVSKYQLGLKKFRPIKEAGVRSDINNLNAKSLKRFFPLATQNGVRKRVKESGAQLNQGEL